MINIIFTGLIRTEDRFKKSISDFVKLKSKGLINQIILSTWVNELDNYKELRTYLIENNIKIVESTPPSQCKGSFLHQSKSLHCGLDSIEDKSLMIFKTRADLYIEPDALVEIMNLDLTIDKNNPNIFEKKVWLPWFEISKPFYLADECFFATFNDMNKLVNYDMIYGSYFETDSGLSHIRRFIHPFLAKYPIFNIFLKYLATTAHGTLNRFEVLDKFMLNENYWQFIYLYYFILKNYFYIGMEKDNYIEFREWSSSTVKLPSDIKESFKKEYSWKKEFGHIYSNNNEWLNNIDFQYSFNFDIEEDSLIELHKFAIVKKNESMEKTKLEQFKQVIKRLIKR